MSQSGDVLERFVEALVQQITATRPEYLTAPFAVAEIYQDLEFAAVDVRLHPSRVPVGAGDRPKVHAEVEADGPSAEPAASNPSEAEPAKPSRPEPGGSGEDGVVGHIETASSPPLASVEAAAPHGPDSTHAESGDVMTVCHWCREDLPVRDSIHFCPFCGSDLRPSPCRECGEAMEARWQFCVSCGTDVRG